MNIDISVSLICMVGAQERKAKYLNSSCLESFLDIWGFAIEFCSWWREMRKGRNKEYLYEWFCGNGSEMIWWLNLAVSAKPFWSRRKAPLSTKTSGWQGDFGGRKGRPAPKYLAIEKTVPDLLTVQNRVEIAVKIPRTLHTSLSWIMPSLLLSVTIWFRYRQSVILISRSNALYSGANFTLIHPNQEELSRWFEAGHVPITTSQIITKAIMVLFSQMSNRLFSPFPLAQEPIFKCSGQSLRQISWLGDPIGYRIKDLYMRQPPRRNGRLSGRSIQSGRLSPHALSILFWPSFLHCS